MLLSLSMDHCNEAIFAYFEYIGYSLGVNCWWCYPAPLNWQSFYEFGVMLIWSKHPVILPAQYYLFAMIWLESDYQVRRKILMYCVDDASKDANVFQYSLSSCCDYMIMWHYGCDCQCLCCSHKLIYPLSRM